MNHAPPAPALRTIRAAAYVVTVLLGLLLVPATARTALADTPPAPVAAFNARCAGTTNADPTAAPGAYGDLTRVEGKRLEDYNAGHAVILYDYFGESDPESAPPVCAVHHDARTGGPVTEWMYCTDLKLHVCGTTAADGALVDKDGSPVGPLLPQAGNEKLSADQEKLITYLIQHGHSFDRAQDTTVDATQARSDGTTWERWALQLLVWCVSDAPYDDKGVCAANLPQSEQDAILARIPNDPVLTLASPSGTHEVGQVARFTLTTNLYGQDLTVRTTGAARLAVCGGTATLDGDTLVVRGDDPTRTSAVQLCATGTAPGAVTLEVTGTPAATEKVRWNQSAHSIAGEQCQHYASFSEETSLEVTTDGRTRFVAAQDEPTEPTDQPTTGPGGPGGTGDSGNGGTGGAAGTSAGGSGSGVGGASAGDGTLPDTGSPMSGGLLGLAGGLLGLGALMTLWSRQRTGRHRA